MEPTQQHADAPAEQKIDLILEDLSKLKGSLLDAKFALKDFKIKSDRLTQLKNARKEMTEQINEEKDRIENEYYDDKDYEKNRNAELTLKNQIKEKTGELKAAVKSKFKMPDFQTEMRVVRGEQVKMQFDFSPNLYLNGRELK